MRLRALALTAALTTMTAAVASAASWETGLTSYRIAGSYSSCSAPPDCLDGPSAVSGRFGNPSGLALDASGNVYIADYGDDLVRRATSSGALTTLSVAGTFATDGAPSPQRPDGPGAVAIGPDGALYVATEGHNPTPTGNQVLRFAGGAAGVYAGSGVNCTPSTATCGDGGSATAADLSAPAGLAFDAAGNLYIADSGSNRIRKVTRVTGKISTVAGSGTACATATDTCGDGGAATAGQLNNPLGVAVSADGTKVYIADTDDNRIRQVAGGTITTLAGSGLTPCACSDDDNGPATGSNVGLDGPTGVTADPAGGVFIADTNSGRIRHVDTSGTITTIAGVGLSCSFPLLCGNGQAVNSMFGRPNGVVLDGQGGLLVVDGEGMVFWLTPAQPLGIPGPQGAKGDTGPAGANGTGGAQGPAGAKGDKGDAAEQSPVSTFACRKRHLGLGRFATSCLVRVFAADGADVTVRLRRGSRTLAKDTATARGGEARLHLHSRHRLGGVYELRVNGAQPAAFSQRVAI
jgi:DNA-binding beta-propeller fold protein YncE